MLSEIEENLTQFLPLWQGYFKGTCAYKDLCLSLSTWLTTKTEDDKNAFLHQSTIWEHFCETSPESASAKEHFRIDKESKERENNLMNLYKKHNLVCIQDSQYG